MTRIQRSSYIFLVVMLILIAWFHLATPLVTVLFGYFALCKFTFREQKWLSFLLFVLVVTGVFYGFAFFLQHSLVALPRMADQSIPQIIAYAQNHGIELPFTDLDSLKLLLMDILGTEIKSVGKIARIATREFVVIVIGLVVAGSMFLNARFDLDRARRADSLYSKFGEEITARFRSLYRSFEIVMGAQLIISAINTVLTSMFILAVGLPYPWVVIVLTFLCGLLPIVGNIISNTIIVGVAFTISPQIALLALVFLVVIHKLEYFLNSKIIGDRIKNPVWLTLLALILGERLMGIPGMILAPVVFHFVKSEMSKIKLEENAPAPPPAEYVAYKD